MLPVVERDVADGVPVLRTAGPAGRHAAALLFRVGQFDEALPERGITHLVEHLTLGGHHEARYQFNASVDGLYTRYIVESQDPADVAAYLRAVCEGLAADHGAVLERERRILRTEAARNGGVGMLGNCLVERYGARGPGLLNFPEYGVDRLSWADVAAWRSHWFTAGNAVLWVAGDLPDGLRLPLPDGPACPAREAVPLPATWPAYVTGAKGGIAAGLVADRSAASHVTLDILKRRLTQSLRHEHALTYDVALSPMEVDPEHVHAWLAADALPDQVPMAAHVLLSTFETLAANGPEAEELAAYVGRLEDSYQSLAGPIGLLERHAQAVLNGRPPRSAAESIERAAELIGADIAKSAQSLWDSMLVAAPYNVPAVQGRMNAAPLFSATTISGGTVHKPTVGDWPTLTLSDAGVMLTRKPGEHVTVRYAETAALLRWNDGKRSLVGDDGFTIVLDPAQWRNGAAVVSAVSARLPDELVVPRDEPGPAAPQPATAAGPAGGARNAGGEKARAPRPSAASVRARLARIVTGRAFLIICACAVLIGAVVWSAGNSTQASAPLGLVAIVAVVRLLWQLVRRPRR